ncbi:MAG: hypothetical protein AAF226_00780 [Verrucomicrobiota bacterium]
MLIVLTPIMPVLQLANSIIFGNSQWVWPCVAIGAVGLILLGLGYRRISLPSPWKAVAFGLKVLGLALLIVALLEPTRVSQVAKTQSNDVILLADNSEGLALKTKAGKNVGEPLQRTLLSESPEVVPGWLEPVQRDFRVQRYLFGQKLRRVENFGSLDFSETGSALGSSLSSLIERYDKRPLAAIAVFTDGNATDLEKLESFIAEASEMERLPPIFPVVVGGAIRNKPDLAITSLRAQQSSFEDAPLNINLEATASGNLERTVSAIVTNQQGDEVLREALVFPKKDSIRKASVRLKVPAVASGVSFYRVAIEADGEEPLSEVTLKNNSRQVAVDRGRGPYRVLYISGRPNWEYKFLRRALAEDAEIELVGLIRIAKREPKFEWRGRTGETGNPLFRGFAKDLPEETQAYDEPVLIRLNTADSEELRDGFPRTAEDLFTPYHAVVIDDTEAEYFSAEQQNLLESYVSKRGGTLVMLGGQESFYAGGWENTPVARALPVYVDRKIGASGPVRFATFNLSREGWLEPWLRLRDSQEEEYNRLGHMPEFFSINQVPGIKPGASVLATVTDKDQQQHPAIVAQRFGNGRSAAVTVGDFWRWGLKDETLQKDLAKMWRQLIRWSVVDSPQPLTLEVTHRHEGALPSSSIDARVVDLNFDPQDSASVSFQVRRDGNDPSPVTAEPSLEAPGLFQGKFFSEEQGGYRLTATARDEQGEVISRAEAGWVHDPAAAEFRRLEPDTKVLDRLADVTGGEVLALDELSRLKGLIQQVDVPMTETKTQPLWHHFWWLLLALLCLVGEWGLRRWKGGVL